MGKILTLDRGNTAAKISVFDGYECLESRICDSLTVEAVTPVLERHEVEGAAYCCVGHNDVRFIESLRRMLGSPLMVLTRSAALPFGVDYSETLGVDRIAAGAGALAVYGCPMLIADAGTALTLDLVAEGKFHGGRISPGMSLRFNALHEFTSALPRVEAEGECPVFGHDTDSAIRSGVIRGIVAEIREAFAQAREKYPELRLLLTGGDAAFLSRRMADPSAVVDADIVGRGLVSIFNYNFRK